MAHLLLGPPVLILQVDGPEAFTSNEPYMPLGQTLIAWRRLRTRGRKVRDAISPVEERSLCSLCISMPGRPLSWQLLARSQRSGTSIVSQLLHAS